MGSVERRVQLLSMEIFSAVQEHRPPKLLTIRHLLFAICCRSGSAPVFPLPCVPYPVSRSKLVLRFCVIKLRTEVRSVDDLSCADDNKVKSVA